MAPLVTVTAIASYSLLATEIFIFLSKNYGKVLPKFPYSQHRTISLVPMEWDLGLHRPINTLLNQLFVFFHGGFILLDTKVSINVHFISSITGFPKARVDPTQFFIGKEQDKHFNTRMREKYSLTKDKRGFDTASINDKTVRFLVKEISIKFLIMIRLNVLWKL